MKLGRCTFEPYKPVTLQLLEAEARGAKRELEHAWRMQDFMMANYSNVCEELHEVRAVLEDLVDAGFATKASVLEVPEFHVALDAAARYLRRKDKA